MRKILIIFGICFFANLSAQDDSLPSPFSIYFGTGIGAGKSSPSLSGEHYGYEALRNDDAFYADYTYRAGVMWKEKFGASILFGQLANTNDGSVFIDYATNAFPGYTMQPQYSELDYGYRYRYLTPQFSYRIGREPFNLTLNAGVGIGKLQGSSGLVIYKNDTSNSFIQQSFSTLDVWNLNGTVSAEVAYMRQLSQHWFWNVGLYVSYTSLMQDYQYSQGHVEYGYMDGFYFADVVSGVQHHGAAGVFMYFQWNTKESPRAYYE